MNINISDLHEQAYDISTEDIDCRGHIKSRKGYKQNNVVKVSPLSGFTS